MRRYPPSTIYRYLDITSSHPPSSWPRTPIHSPHHHPHNPNQPHHRNPNTDTCHTLSLCVQYWQIPNPILSSSHHHNSHPPRAKHIHISDTPPTPLTPCITLISITSSAQDTTLEPRVPPIHSHPALTATTLPRLPHQHCCHPRILTLS